MMKNDAPKVARLLQVKYQGKGGKPIGRAHFIPPDLACPINAG